MVAGTLKKANAKAGSGRKGISHDQGKTMDPFGKTTTAPRILSKNEPGKVKNGRPLLRQLLKEKEQRGVGGILEAGKQVTQKVKPEMTSRKRNGGIYKKKK